MEIQSSLKGARFSSEAKGSKEVVSRRPPSSHPSPQPPQPWPWPEVAIWFCLVEDSPPQLPTLGQRETSPVVLNTRWLSPDKLCVLCHCLDG